MFNSLFYPSYTTRATKSVFTSKVNLTAHNLRLQLTVEFWQLTTETGSDPGHLHEHRFSESSLTVLREAMFCPDMFSRLQFRHTERWTPVSVCVAAWIFATLRCELFTRREVKWSEVKLHPEQLSHLADEHKASSWLALLQRLKSERAWLFLRRSHGAPRTQIETSEGK